MPAPATGAQLATLFAAIIASLVGLLFIGLGSWSLVPGLTVILLTWLYLVSSHALRSRQNPMGVAVGLLMVSLTVRLMAPALGSVLLAAVPFLLTREWPRLSSAGIAALLALHGLAWTVLVGLEQFGVLLPSTEFVRTVLPIEFNALYLVIYALAIALAWPSPPPPEPEKPRRASMSTELLEAQKLESLGVLAGGIAHDFNNLLTSVLGNANIAITEVEPGPVRDTLLEIEVAAKRAKELVAQLLSYAGRGSVEQSAVDFGGLVEEMASLLRRVISPRANLQFQTTGDSMLVEGDPAQLRQVVMNLITNASDALGDGHGTIQVRVATVDLPKHRLKQTLLPDAKPGTFVMFEVIDSGVGMDEETLHRIFEPFFTTKVTGRGLGLAAILGIVREHGGTLAVASQPGRGTTFRIYLPWAEEAVETEDIKTEHAVRASTWKERKGTVLLAEDEEIVRKVTVRMLKKLGLQVLVARDGQEAVDLYKLHREELSLVILDVQMPRKDGRSAMAEMVEITPDLPVIIMSGYSDRRISDYGRRPNAYLPKPFSMRDVIRALDQALDQPLKPGRSRD